MKAGETADRHAAGPMQVVIRGAWRGPDLSVQVAAPQPQPVAVVAVPMAVPA